MTPEEEVFQIIDEQTHHFTIIYHEMRDVFARRIGIAGVAVYYILKARANVKGFCYPSIKSISEDLDTSESTVKRTLKLLEDEKLIRIVSRKEQGLPNYYALLDIHKADEGSRVATTPPTPDTNGGRSHRPTKYTHISNTHISINTHASDAADADAPENPEKEFSLFDKEEIPVAGVASSPSSETDPPTERPKAVEKLVSPATLKSPDKPRTPKDPRIDIFYQFLMGLIGAMPMAKREFPVIQKIFAMPCAPDAQTVCECYKEWYCSLDDRVRINGWTQPYHFWSHGGPERINRAMQFKRTGQKPMSSNEAAVAAVLAEMSKESAANQKGRFDNLEI